MGLGCSLPIPTNKLGILIAEIDSGGALRSAGDRVILGSRNSKTEQEWVVRQKIAECTARITESVHDNHGIVARRAAESAFGTFPHAADALNAACNIQEVQAEEARNSMDHTNSAPLGLRLGLTYGKMIVDAGQVSGDAIYVASQLAGRASSGQIFAAESIINALGDEVRGKVKSLGSVNLDDVQGDTEIFEIQWNHVTEETPSAPTAETATPEETGAPEETAPAGPQLSIQNRGKEIVLGTKRPSVTLRSGKERELHAKIELRDDRFVLVNLNTTGTRVRVGNEESLCLDELELEGAGAISLGQDFREGSPEVLDFSRLS